MWFFSTYDDDQNGFSFRFRQQIQVPIKQRNYPQIRHFKQDRNMPNIIYFEKYYNLLEVLRNQGINIGCEP